MDHHGSSWIIMDPYGSLWIIMDHHGLSWIIMDHHGSSWIIKDLFESSGFPDFFQERMCDLMQNLEYAQVYLNSLFLLMKSNLIHHLPSNDQRNNQQIIRQRRKGSVYQVLRISVKFDDAMRHK